MCMRMGDSALSSLAIEIRLSGRDSPRRVNSDSSIRLAIVSQLKSEKRSFT